jgi:glycerol-1-phosphate dehydrogenase [NAD(P)+]
MERIDPANVAHINERVSTWSSLPDETHAVRIERIVIGEDAIDALVDEVKSRARGQRVLLVADHTPMRRGGDDLKPLIADALGRVCEPRVRLLPENPAQRFHAELDAAEQLAAELGDPQDGFAAIVSVGSGCITDVAKYARHICAQNDGRRLAHICFPTAASVTAYTSALAVVTIAGAKRTLPTAAPDAVICDLRTLTDAPSRMTQAGFGDVLARSVSYGDWYLANQLGMDDGFSLVPGKLLEQAECEMLERAEGVATGQAGAIRSVVEALLLAGMAMSIVRQTAPLSGWEHAMSHFLDLAAKGDGRELALHGGQVGIASLISARAYESAWREFDPERLIENRADEFYIRPLEQTFGRGAESIALVSELWRELFKKVTRWRDSIEARRRFADRKRAGEFDAFISRHVRAADEIDDALQRAGAPRRWCDLDEPVGESSALAAVRCAHLVRARFTLGDLLTEADWLGPARADELLSGLTS